MKQDDTALEDSFAFDPNQQAETTETVSCNPDCATRSYKLRNADFDKIDAISDVLKSAGKKINDTEAVKIALRNINLDRNALLATLAGIREEDGRRRKP